MSGTRVIFAGTPEFAVRSLTALVDAGIRPVAVLTQPDRPAGRGKKLTQSPVKCFAAEHMLTVLQPTTLRDPDVVASLAAFEADIAIVAAYGLILPQNILDLPAAGCLNVHASLLPRWRGAAPVQAAILAGDGKTGVCLMSMTAGLDCGPVFACDATAIGAAETGGELAARLADMGAALLIDRLGPILAGTLDATPQDDSLATYAHKIGNADAELDWVRPAEELSRTVRAFNPAPGAWFMLGDERIKCWQAALMPDAGAAAGAVVETGAQGIVVACGQGALRLESLQRPGKKPVTAREFAAQFELAGRRL